MKKTTVILISLASFFIGWMAGLAGVRHEVNTSLQAAGCVQTNQVRLSSGGKFEDCTLNYNGSSNAIYLTSRASTVTVRNVTINSDSANCGINFDGASGDVLIENVTINGHVAWGICGSNSTIRNVTIRNVRIIEPGRAASYQTHGIYLNNCQECSVEDSYIEKAYNTGIKVVGETWDLTIKNNTITGSGRAGESGPGISLGENSRVSHIHDITITGNTIENSINPAIWILDNRNPPYNITITDNYFKDNYYAVQIGQGGRGYVVEGNTGWNEASYSYARPPLQIESLSDALNSSNIFNRNNWYFDGRDPVRIGSTSYSLKEWQALSGKDLDSTSVNPKVSTPTPIITLTPRDATKTPQPAPSTPTLTATYTATASVTPSKIPTVTRTPTPSRMPSPASATPGPEWYCTVGPDQIDCMRP